MTLISCRLTIRDGIKSIAGRKEQEMVDHGQVTVSAIQLAWQLACASGSNRTTFVTSKNHADQLFLRYLDIVNRTFSASPCS